MHIGKALAFPAVSYARKEPRGSERPHFSGRTLLAKENATEGLRFLLQVRCKYIFSGRRCQPPVLLRISIWRLDKPPDKKRGKEKEGKVKRKRCSKMKTEITYMNDMTEVVGGIDVIGHDSGCSHSGKVPTGNRERQMKTFLFLTVYRDMVEYRCPKCGRHIWEEE